MCLSSASIFKSYAGILSLKEDMSCKSNCKNKYLYIYRNKSLKKITLLKWTLIYLEHEKRWINRLPIIWCKYIAESLFNFNVSCTLSPLIFNKWSCYVTNLKDFYSMRFSCKRSQSLDNDSNFHCFLLTPER